MAVELRGSGEIEGDKAGSSKPSRLEKITSALTAIEADGTVADCITETPGAFLWEFYKAWVDNGGQDGGKNRNSIRRMRDVWLTGKQEVKSLHPKLSGSVRVSRDDARSLISLFLERWRYVGGGKAGSVALDGYEQFPCQDAAKLRERLVDALYPAGSKQTEIGLRLPARSSGPHRMGTNSNWEEITKLYHDLDAYITLSRHNTAIGPSASETIRLFWHFMTYLYENVGEKDPVFIWIIDIGRRQVEDDNAWKDFLNFEMLKTQFRAIASFDSETDLDDAQEAKFDRPSPQRSGIHDAFLRSITIPEEGHREKRWKWLCERTVVVLQNLRKEEFEHLYTDEDQQVGKYRLRDIGVSAENILPTMIPPRWAQLRELRELYGRELKDVSEATLTVLLKLSDKNVRSSTGPARYFAHALAPTLAEDTPLSSASLSRELTSPGSHYDEAMSLVYWAARHRLKTVRGDQDNAHAEDWEIATAYLINQGFRAIRLPEFMSIHRSPGD